MGRQDDGHAVAVAELEEVLEEIAAGTGIEPGGGLVEEQELRSVQQSLGELDPPRQTARKGLDEIAGILDASDVHAWKTIARARLARLDEEIARLQLARAYLSGALLCRYDHPATDCRIMQTEIDRRLTEEADF